MQETAKVVFGCASRNSNSSFVTVASTDLVHVGNNYAKSRRQVKGSLLTNNT